MESLEARVCIMEVTCRYSDLLVGVRRLPFAPFYIDSLKCSSRASLQVLQDDFCRRQSPIGKIPRAKTLHRLDSSADAQRDLNQSASHTIHIRL